MTKLKSGSKKRLLQLCMEFLQQRINTSRGAMVEAQDSANTEERSTAGDKYETSREMAMAVRDMNAKQLQAALNDLELLQRINPERVCKQAELGAMVRTSQGNYFMSVSGGPFMLDKEKWLGVSPSSPLGKTMLHKKEEEEFSFRDQKIKIIEIT